MKNGASADTCLLDGSCYTMKILPSIQSVSASEGYTSGGKEIVITGTSLDGSEVSVDVDGTACDITELSESALTC